MKGLRVTQKPDPRGARARWLVPLFALPLLFFLSYACAQNGPLTLAEALESATNRTEVVTARLELADARAHLSRVEGDPMALRPDLVRAQQRVTLAEASYRGAYYAALRELAGAYTNLLEAGQQVALAEGGVALAEQALTIAQIRAERGSATSLDAQDAGVALENARNSLRAAQEGRSLAENRLEGVLGRAVSALEPLPEELVGLPALEAALAASQEHPDLLNVQQGLELAQLNVDLLDPSYTAQAQIDAAQTQLDAAQEGLREAQRGFDLQVRNLYASAQSAAEGYRIGLEALANADERLEGQRQRLESGLIPEIEYKQAELDNRQARLRALQARHAYLDALLELQAGALLGIPGLETPGLDAPQVEENGAPSGGE